MIFRVHDLPVLCSAGPMFPITQVFAQSLSNCFRSMAHIVAVKLLGMEDVEPSHGKQQGLPPSRQPFTSRGDWIRTSDHLHPMQVRYRAALHPEFPCPACRSDHPAALAGYATGLRYTPNSLVPHFAATIPPHGGIRYRAALHPEFPFPAFRSDHPAAWRDTLPGCATPRKRARM